MLFTSGLMCKKAEINLYKLPDLTGTFWKSVTGQVGSGILQLTTRCLQPPQSVRAMN